MISFAFTMLSTVGSFSSPCNAETLKAMSTRSCATNHCKEPQAPRKALSKCPVSFRVKSIRSFLSK